jgi:hypothetical protein
MSPTLRKLVKRLALLAAVGVVITQMLPSLADQLSPNPEVATATPTPSLEASSSPSPTASPISSATPVAEPTADITYAATDSPTAKAKVLESNSLVFRVPNSLQVDPRARSLRTDAFALGGAQNILVCIASSKANVSLATTANVLSEGQGSRSLTVSGTTAAVLSALTSGQGITAVSAGTIAGSAMTFRVAAVSKATTDVELCNEAKITRSTAITALGIDLNTVKIPVKMGKK